MKTIFDYPNHIDLEWIDVKDRKPPFNTPVFVHVKESQFADYVTVGVYCFTGDWFINLKKFDNNVRHWAEMPKPPKKIKIMTKAKEYWAVKEYDTIYLFSREPFKNSRGVWVEDSKGTRKTFCMSPGAFPEFPNDGELHRVRISLIE